MSCRIFAINNPIQKAVEDHHLHPLPSQSTFYISIKYLTADLMFRSLCHNFIFSIPMANFGLILVSFFPNLGFNWLTHRHIYTHTHTHEESLLLGFVPLHLTLYTEFRSFHQKTRIKICTIRR